MPHIVRVELDERPYDVTIGAGVLDDLATLLQDRVGDRPAMVVLDNGLPPSVGERVKAQLGQRATIHTVTPSERDKSLQTLEAMLRAMTVAELGRGDPVVAIGGGVVGDVAGFAAACYRRGVPVIQCPTTLLSMVDASVGGKTGVNLVAGADDHLHKNMVGAFHQPRAVLADVALLDSLPDRHLRSGLAECVKHGMLSAGWGDAGLSAWIDDQAERLLTRDHDTLSELVRRNVTVKASVVVTDEREEQTDRAGGRAQLNLGHTFGHAFETLPGVRPAHRAGTDLHHGEAVAVGLVAASEAAVRLGLCDPQTPAQTRDRLERVGLPISLTGLPGADAVLRRMRSDKKVIAGSLRLVLPASAGTCVVATDPPEQVVLEAIDAIRA